MNLVRIIGLSGNNEWIKKKVNQKFVFVLKIESVNW